VPRILVVDDSVTIRRAVRNVLHEAGYDVVLAADGLEAIALLPELTPALVLTDLHMPRCNGIALVHYINTTWPTLPVIMWTVEHTLDAEALARQCRIHGCMTKPVDIDTLLACITCMLASARGFP
jgi:chemosensory pili system protein ChpA (sensor histidine kinase/response regulator)